MENGKTRGLLWVCGAALTASLCVTEALILIEYGIREALPLHLCGVSALFALGVTVGWGGFALDFLWYLGIPGAVAALLFPAPALSRWQPLLNASYTSTHALIIAIPLLALAGGREPSRRRGAQMSVALAVLALAVFFVNRMLGTDYLFLMRPPVGTPLEMLFAKGHGVYLFCLGGIAAAFCAGMEGVLEAALPVCGRLRGGSCASSVTGT